MKFSALAALVGAANAAGTCTWNWDIFTDGSPCTGTSETAIAWTSVPINECWQARDPATGELAP